MAKVSLLERLELRLTPRELAELDACATLAKLDRSKLLRHLVRIAYQDMVYCFPDRAIAPPTEPARPIETGAAGNISAEIPPG